MTVDHQGQNSAPSVWVLTDGKIGDDVQCLAIAKGLSPAFEARIIHPRALFAAAMPWGPIDPRDRPENTGSPIAQPFPAIVVASGRRAIPYARAVKRASGGRTRIVLLKNPRIGAAGADIIWAPAHDRMQAANVISTLTSPHEMTMRIEQARANPAPAIAGLPRPMLGVVLGGPSGRAQYGAATLRALSERVGEAAKDYASIAITPSRRTPDRMVQSVERGLMEKTRYIWDGSGGNPYADILAQADALIVTADSHNMMSEAMASGTGVYVFRPPGLAGKLSWFVDALEELGAVRPLDGKAAPFKITPIDKTPNIVEEIRSRLGLGAC